MDNLVGIEDNWSKGVIAVKEQLDLIMIQLKELTQIVTAVRDRQDETDAKLEALAMDVHALRGDMTQVQQDLSEVKQDAAGFREEMQQFRKETRANFRKLEGHMSMWDHDPDNAIERIEQLESR
ncbi:hypothetical protein [Paenibacillus koleovorans]|uniref:hypothetical protein n=1 Tax=Paenibacillus koleovorans TaxID=121608 RepID=UPI000FDAFCF6|nr:hypothetical protein [Paenibacillus koleovorans]